jgi:hypothetical protein
MTGAMQVSGCISNKFQMLATPMADVLRQLLPTRLSWLKIIFLNANKTFRNTYMCSIWKRIIVPEQML